MPSPRAGFTLIEVILALTLIAIMAAVGAPRVHSILARQQVDRTAQIAASDMRAAFTSAARGRIPVRITVPASGTGYLITNVATGDTIIRKNFATGDVTVKGITGSLVTVDVFPNGMAAAPDTVTVSTTGYSRKLSISRVGFVRVLP
jgi:prepilin-type N-terminal cleavage/methylation domain-containing protein